jgi:hypothetical protein
MITEDTRGMGDVEDIGHKAEKSGDFVERTN